MKLHIVCLVLGAVSLFLFIMEKLKRTHPAGTIKKAVTSFFFIAVAVFSAYYSESGFSSVLVPFVSIGLVMGLLGDIWLDLRGLYPKDDSFLFYSGFASFAVGHIFFILGMILQFYKKGNVLYIIAPLVLSLVISIVYVSMEKIMKVSYGQFKGAVLLYGAMLFSTTLMALSLLILNGFSAVTLIFIFIGGVLFATSDLILCGLCFGNREGKKLDSVLNYLTYYGGQYLIALSLLFL